MKIRYQILLLLASLPQVANAQKYICMACAAGSFTKDGKTCEKCPEGTMSSSSGSAQCTTCAAGTYSKAGATSCTTCSPGTYNTRSGSSGCTVCQAGYACTGGNRRISCSAGTYSKEGSTSCKTCPSGTYNTGSNNRICKSCEAGYKCSGGSNHVSCLTLGISSFAEKYYKLYSISTNGTVQNLPAGIYRVELGGAKGCDGSDHTRGRNHYGGDGGKGQLQKSTFKLTSSATYTARAPGGCGQSAVFSMNTGLNITAAPGNKGGDASSRKGGSNGSDNRTSFGVNTLSDTWIKLYRVDLNQACPAGPAFSYS